MAWTVTGGATGSAAGVVSGDSVLEMVSVLTLWTGLLAGAEASGDPRKLRPMATAATTRMPAGMAHIKLSLAGLLVWH